jgi:cyclic pyranopterin monophosphate synthase
MSEFTHINEQGRAHMVDVSEKPVTKRVAVAFASLRMKPETRVAIQSGGTKKGDVLSVSQVAGIMAAKKTSDLIPMCHPIPITKADIRFEYPDDPNLLYLYTTVVTKSETGVEMEALTAASIAALTIYDMCKAIDREIEILKICLLEKTGGKSGDFHRDLHS